MKVAIDCSNRLQYVRVFESIHDSICFFFDNQLFDMILSVAIRMFDVRIFEILYFNLDNPIRSIQIKLIIKN